MYVVCVMIVSQMFAQITALILAAFAWKNKWKLQNNFTSKKDEDTDGPSFFEALLCAEFCLCAQHWPLFFVVPVNLHLGI